MDDPFAVTDQSVNYDNDPEQISYNDISVLKDLPFYPLNAIGLPLPGPNFIYKASLLGDDINIAGKGSNKKLISYGKHLDSLYRQATYVSGFMLQVAVRGQLRDAQFIPGHLWGSNEVVGPKRAKVMILGKWPGQEELKIGRNLVGPSGEVLIRALETLGIPKSEYDYWYITNLVKHPNVDPSANRLPKDWIKDGLPILNQELRLVRPEIILCLGAEASEAILGKEVGGVTMTQGRVMTINIPLHISDQDKSEFCETKVMTCIHPAAVARSPDRTPEFHGALKKFIEQLTGESTLIVKEKLDHRIIYTERQLAATVDEIIKYTINTKEAVPIAIDTEWHGDYPTEPGAWLRTFQFSWKSHCAACVVLRHQGGKPAFLPTIESCIPHLIRLFTNTDKYKCRVVGQHLRADLPWIKLGLDEELGNLLINGFNAPLDDPDADGEHRLFGWQKTLFEGGFDTMLACHAVQETANFKLEVMANHLCNVPRYDSELQKWKKEYTLKHKMKMEDLEGYGACPDSILHIYALFDSDATRRLFDVFNGTKDKPGLLDRDQYGNCSRYPFWLSMRAAPAFLEMEMTGIKLDRKRAEELTNLYMNVQAELLSELQSRLKWPGFNPNSSYHCRTALFGPNYSGKLDEYGNCVDIRPNDDAVSLNLIPVKTTGKPAKQWDRVVAKGDQKLYTPSSDKEVLGILASKLQGQPGYEEVCLLRNVKFIGQILKSVLGPPIKDDNNEIEYNEDGEMEFDRGLINWMMHDGYIRTHMFATKETGRSSSARPPLQNISKRRETDYERILKDRYKCPIRSIFEAPPDCVLVEADYLGAELFIMAIQSNSKKMIEHCQRGNLPEDDPNFYDIHSNIAVKAFKLDCKPTKNDLKRIGKLSLRIAAKSLMFGVPYGRGDEAVVRAVEEEGVKITVTEAAMIRESIFSNYQELEPYFEACKARPHYPGWMANCFGRYRRFQKTTDRVVMAELERQAGNFCIQSGVADSVNLALDYLYNYPEREDKFKILLQIHDAILFAVKIPYIDWFCNKVLQECMTDRVPIYKCDLDGIPDMNSPAYHMGTDKSVMLHWGEKIDYETSMKLNIPEKYLAKPKK